jgi:hypothetical protein
MSGTCTHSNAEAALHLDCAGCSALLQAALVAVSATCFHPDAEAALHPGCAGCCALLYATQWSAAARPMEAVLEAQPQVQRAWLSDPSWIVGLALRDVRTVASRAAEIRGHGVERLIVDDPNPRPSLLPDRPLTSDERAAHDDDPRPGVWAGESGANLRKLTQNETDQLIRNELLSGLAPLGLDPKTPAKSVEMRGICGEWRVVEFTPRHASPATRQRGGIDSDPLVRLLAYRAWGDRDRRWFELRGVRKGDPVAVLGATHAGGHASDGSHVLTVALARSPGEEVGTALEDAWPGELVMARFDAGQIDGLDRYAPAKEVFRLGGYAFASTGTLDVECRVADRPIAALASSPLLDVPALEREPGTLGIPTTTTDDSAPPVPDPDPDAPHR